MKTLAARAQEYFHLYRQLLIDARAFDHVELVVLTGGGAMLPGIADAAAAEMGKRAYWTATARRRRVGAAAAA